MVSKEKRRFQRYRKQVGFSLAIGGTIYKATTEDYSVNGLSAVIEGPAPVKAGDFINLEVPGIRVKSPAKIVRVSKDAKGVRIGVIRQGLLHGSLEDFDVADVLMGLHRSSMTGVLYVKSGNIQKNIDFRNGDMIFAISNLLEDRMGDMLMREGRITLAQYNESSEIMKREKKRHGTVMVEMGLLTPAELFSAVKRSVENVIISILSIRSGDFLIKEGGQKDEEITLNLSTANLIYRGVKAIEDISVIKSMCPKADEVLYFSSDPLDLFQDLQFSDEDRAVLSIVDGKKTFREIVDKSGLDTFKAMQGLCAFLNTRIIEVQGEDSMAGVTAEDIAFNEIFDEHQQEQEAAAEAKAKVEAAAKAKAKVEDVASVKAWREKTDAEQAERAAQEKAATGQTGQVSAMTARIEEMHKMFFEQDYYAVLGVGKNATGTQIKRAYYMRAKDFHPDKHYYLPGDAKGKLNDIFTKITSAYSTLNSPDLRAAYDRDPMKGRATELDPAERAEQKFEEAMSLMKGGRQEEAASVFGEAAYLMSDEPKYHYYTGLAFAGCGKHKEAERTFQRAIKLDPSNADYFAETGHAYLALGFNLRAKSSFEKALNLDASHKRAMDGMKALPDS
jgi:curved DNA-binding protein CbpA